MLVQAEDLAGPPFKFTFSETFVPMGQVGCVDVTVEGFENVTSFEIGIAYDPSIFFFSSAQTIAFDPTEISAFSAENDQGQEILTVIFANFFSTTTLTDGTIAFSLCFEALGNDGDFTELMFSETIANGNPSLIFADGMGWGPPDLCVVGANLIIGDQPIPLDIMTTEQPSTCESSGDGILEIEISGGSEPYSLLVTDCDSGDIIRGPEPVGSTVVLNNLNAGDYCIEVSDNSTPSQIFNTSAEIMNNGPSLGATFTLAEPSCNGFMNGSIEVMAVLNAVEQTNPNADFNFVWTQTGGQGPVVGPDLINLESGNYEVEITEIASGCSTTQSVTLTEPAAVDVNIEVVNVTCLALNLNDGSVAAVTTGGVGPYSFVWDDTNSSTDSLVTDLPAGNYTVQVQDSNNCIGTDTEMITAPLPPQIVGFDSVSISCPGVLDGELEVLTMDGSSPVDQILWIDPAGNNLSGARITGLGSGDYLVTVVGVDNCMTSMQVTLGEPAGVEIDVANTTVTDPECNDSENGSLGISIVGGTGPFTIFLNGDVQAGQAISNLPPGSYDVYIEDSAGCESATETFILNRPPPITVEFIDLVPLACFEGTGGQATAVPMNGPSTYNFIWETGETNASAMSLMAGEQSLRVVSGNCSLDTFVLVEQPDEIMIEASTMDVSCFGENDGEIELTLSGGTGMLDINTMFPIINGTTIENLSANFYTVIVSDENNCEKAVTFEISEPDSLDAFILDVQNITCPGEADGIVVAGSDGGTGSVTFQWNSGSADMFNTNNNLLAGDYIVTATDANGCIDTAMATIVEPTPISAIIPPIAEAPCFGEQTEITVSQATGGNGAPYTFTINAGPAVPIGSEIPIFAGEYTITVFDGLGCRETIDVTATEPQPLVVNLGADQEINLGGSTTIFANISSALNIDSIYWLESPADTTLSCYDCTVAEASPLDDTFYEIFVRDENGCVGSDEVFINVDSDRNVYIPNAFTPNVDGFNDFFSPFTGVGVENVLSFEIFDRWGELVFSKGDFVPGSSEANGWDGTFRGKIASKGVYFYIINIEFIDGVVLTYRGNVTLM